MIKLENRVTKVERDMEVRQDVTDARALASAADKNVSDVQAGLRAHITTLEALSENQRDLHKEMRSEFTAVRSEIDVVRSEMREGFTKMREGFTKVGLGMAQITAKLNIAIGRDEPAD